MEIVENKILLVDDEKDVRDMLNLSLSALGYNVLEAEDGIQALKIFNEANPLIVLTDIKMPGMDGIELLQKVKRNNPDVETIMITGHGDIDLVIKSLKYEATDFVAKPVDLDALKIALRRVQNKIVIRKQLNEYTENLERLVREKAELQSHLSSLGLMISSISHGIKGLLTGLDYGMYKLDKGFKKGDRERMKEGWQTVKISFERIRKMILDILYYAKERDLDLNQVDVLSFVKEVSKIFESKMEAKNITFATAFNSDLAECEFDNEQIHSALVNILENAVDACSKDKSKGTHRIIFGVKQQKNNIVFEIVDDGVGMDEDTKENIFTPFFSSKGKEGTGLGLFITNKTVEQHGGYIEVKSHKGQGTKFTVKIPKTLTESIKIKGD